MSSSTIDVIVSAQDKARAVLRSTDRALRQTRQTLEGMEPAQRKLSSAVETARFAMQAFAASAGVAAVRALFDVAKEGARAADQFDAVAGRVRNLNQIIEQTKAASTGIISQAEIVKATALFDAFGLEVAQIPEALTQAAKTSLRTGEDMGNMIESLTRGVSRQSAAILDNLGVILKLDDVRQRAAESLGKEVDALTDAETKAQLLSDVIGQLALQNQDIDLNDSRTASLQRLETAWTDAKDAASQYLAEVADLYLGVFGGQLDAAKALTDELVTLTITSDAYGETLDQSVTIGRVAATRVSDLGVAFSKLNSQMQSEVIAAVADRLGDVSTESRDAAMGLLQAVDAYRELEAAANAPPPLTWVKNARAEIGRLIAEAAKVKPPKGPTRGGKSAAEREAEAAARAAQQAQEAADRQYLSLVERVRLLRHEQAILQATGDIERANLEYTREVDTIWTSIVDSEERSLALSIAKLNHDKDVLSIQTRIADEAARAAADVVDFDMFANMASPEEIERLQRGFRADDMAAGFNAAANALQQFASIAGADETVAKFGALGGALSEVGSQFADLSRMASIGAGDIAAAASASLGALAPTVAAFGSTVAEKAGIMAAFEVAQGVATAFYNPAESATHFAAAAMFGALAGASAGGVKIGPGGGKSSGGGGFMPSQSSGDSGGSQSATYVINVGPSQGGMIIGTDQTIARAIAEQMHSARGTGHRAAA